MIVFASGVGIKFGTGDQTKTTVKGGGIGAVIDQEEKRRLVVEALEFGEGSGIAKDDVFVSALNDIIEKRTRNRENGTR